VGGWHLLRWPLVVLVIALGLGHMFRYESLNESDSLRLTTVWDRWTHQTCVYGFFEARVLSCSPEALAVSAAQAKSPAMAPSRIEVLRSGGFSEDEIKTWIEKETKALKSLGVSQSDIDRYFTDATFPKPTGKRSSR